MASFNGAGQGRGGSGVIVRGVASLMGVTPWVKPQNRFFVTMLRNVGGLLFLAARPPCVFRPTEPRRTKPNQTEPQKTTANIFIFLPFFGRRTPPNPAEPQKKC